MKKLLLILLMLPTLSFAEKITFSGLEYEVVTEYETYMKNQTLYEEPHVCDIRLIRVEDDGRAKAYKGIMFTSKREECDFKEAMRAIAVDVWKFGDKIVWRAFKATN